LTERVRVEERRVVVSFAWEREARVVDLRVWREGMEDRRAVSPRVKALGGGGGGGDRR